jgi:hypothetical protein
MKQRIFSIKKLAVLAAGFMLSASAFAYACGPANYIYNGHDYPAVVYNSNATKHVWLTGDADGVSDLRRYNMDNQITTICVKPGYRIIIFQGYRFTGYSYELHNGFNNGSNILSRDWWGKISSVLLVKDDPSFQGLQNATASAICLKNGC